MTSAVHFAGLVGLSWVMRRGFMRNPDRMAGTMWQGITIVGIVVGLFCLHAIQIWMYAVVYLWLDQFETVEAALYFSTTTFTTVGYGDVYLETGWRMLAAAESANGFLMIGWSTAFLVSLTSRIRAFESEVEAGFRDED
ncbi:MAG: potassium channel family protein [Henriciella sp.]|nr:potassium channel family protein [Henriciella sp.]